MRSSFAEMASLPRGKAQSGYGEEYEKTIFRALDARRFLDPPPTPLESGIIPDFLNEARIFALHHAPYDRLWNGDRLQRKMELIGKTIPYVSANETLISGGVPTVMGYIPVNGERLVISERFVCSMSVASVSTFLIHEATHMVVRDLFVELSGISADRIDRLSAFSSDLRGLFLAVQEILAFTNHATYARHLDVNGHQIRGEMDSYGGIVVAFVYYQEQGPKLLSKMKKFIESYVHTILSAYDEMYPVQLKRTGLPVYASGPESGMYFSPIHVAPEILGPFFK